MKVYPENDGVEFRAKFFSAPGVPTVPESIHWRLVCLTTDTVLRDWDEVSYETVTDDSGAIVEVSALIEVSGEYNGIQDSNNRRETKQLEVVAAKGTSRQRSKWYRYAIAAAGVP